MSFLEKIFGNYSEKELKKINPIVDKIESYDSARQALSDEELRAKTDEFKSRLAAGETLDEACAVHGMDCDKVLADINEYLANK